MTVVAFLMKIINAAAWAGLVKLVLMILDKVVYEYKVIDLSQYSTIIAVTVFVIVITMPTLNEEPVSRWSQTAISVPKPLPPPRQLTDNENLEELQKHLNSS